MNSVVKRIVYRIELLFVSPVNVSSGLEGTTDSDVLRDYDGHPFISGSSIAGAFRAYVQSKNNGNDIFGFANDEDGKMSPVFISDLKFNKSETDIRDSVALDDNKITKEGAKFDFEVLQGNSKGYFYIELTIREKDNEELLVGALNEIFNGIHLKEIRLGSNKTRGYGIIDIDQIKKREFTKNNFLDYKDCYREPFWKKNVKEYDLDYSTKGHMMSIEVPLRLKGGISIRKYAVRKGAPDFEHITDHGSPVIPGTSIMGALRHRIKEIIKELDKDSSYGLYPNKMIDEIFGFVSGKDAHISGVIVDEMVIEGAKALEMTRTGISRFENSARNGALYKEKTYVDGVFTLRLSVCRENPNMDWIIGILLLAVKDLQNGFLAVGGQTSIGRGIFEANGPLTIDGEENKEDEYIASSIVKYKEMDYEH